MGKRWVSHVLYKKAHANALKEQFTQESFTVILNSSDWLSLEKHKFAECPSCFLIQWKWMVTQQPVHFNCSEWTFFKT